MEEEESDPVQGGERRCVQPTILFIDEFSLVTQHKQRVETDRRKSLHEKKGILHQLRKLAPQQRMDSVFFSQNLDVITKRARVLKAIDEKSRDGAQQPEEVCLI